MTQIRNLALQANAYFKARRLVHFLNKFLYTRSSNQIRSPIDQAAHLIDDIGFNDRTERFIIQADTENGGDSARISELDFSEMPEFESFVEHQESTKEKAEEKLEEKDKEWCKENKVTWKDGFSEGLEGQLKERY